MRLLAASVELGVIDVKDVPREWLSQWDIWQFFRSRDGSPITDCADPHWSDAPRVVKKAQPIELPKKRDNSSPPGTVRVRFLQPAAGPGGAFGQNAIADLPEAQAREMLAVGGVELFAGKATGVPHADLQTERADDAWTPHRAA